MTEDPKEAEGPPKPTSSDVDSGAVDSSGIADRRAEFEALSATSELDEAARRAFTEHRIALLREDQTLTSDQKKSAERDLLRILES